MGCQQTVTPKLLCKDSSVDCGIEPPSANLHRVAVQTTQPSQWITIHGMQTVAELPEFIRIADKLLSLEERQDLVRYLASHAKAGDLMEGTGGVRKLRWRRGDHGKSGGVRVVYYFHDDRMPCIC